MARLDKNFLIRRKIRLRRRINKLKKIRPSISLTNILLIGILLKLHNINLVELVTNYINK